MRLLLLLSALLTALTGVGSSGRVVAAQPVELSASSEAGAVYVAPLARNARHSSGDRYAEVVLPLAHPAARVADRGPLYRDRLRV